MLPGAYERWYQDIAGRPSPVESRSTCSHCAMGPDAELLPPGGAFDPKLECCTYHPSLAPHLVGGILRDGTDEGKRRVRERIAKRVGVSPLGLGPTPEFAAKLSVSRVTPGDFGHNTEVHCPFHGDDQRCTIWQHRGIVCAAFHCKFDRGALGNGFWQLTTQAFNQIERELAKWLLARQELDPEACDALLRAPEDEALDAQAWGRFRGREEEYFLEAQALIEPLDWAAVEAIGGKELSMLREAMRGAVERFAAMVPPERVAGNPGVLVQLGTSGTAHFFNTGAPLDLLVVGPPHGEKLARFGTGTLASLGLDDELVRKLIDWQVLIPAP